MTKEALEIERLIMRVEIYDELLDLKFRIPKKYFKGVRDFYQQQLVTKIMDLPVMKIIEENENSNGSARVITYINEKKLTDGNLQKTIKDTARG